ncbi:hypothetical protein CSUI_002498, partial [Cystoisospora suis]
MPMSPPSPVLEAALQDLMDQGDWRPLPESDYPDHVREYLASLVPLSEPTPDPFSVPEPAPGEMPSVLELAPPHQGPGDYWYRRGVPRRGTGR